MRQYWAIRPSLVATMACLSLFGVANAAERPNLPPAQQESLALAIHGRALVLDSHVDIPSTMAWARTTRQRTATPRSICPSWSASAPARRARVFAMGVNEWRDGDVCPAPGTPPAAFYLTAEGGLADQAGKAGTHGYVYDPNDPTPTVGGAKTGDDNRHAPGPRSYARPIYRVTATRRLLISGSKDSLPTGRARATHRRANRHLTIAATSAA